MADGTTEAYQDGRYPIPAADDRTSLHPQQAHWSPSNLPVILYVLHPTRNHPPRRQLGNPPLKQYPIHGKFLRDIPCLPDNISSHLEGWRYEAWGRLDRRVCKSDILDRINPRYRPAPKDHGRYSNQLQMRRQRFREAASLLPWDKAAGWDDKKNIIEGELLANGINPALNTTRGLSPGLVDLSKGEAGGRVAWPANAERYTDTVHGTPFAAAIAPRRHKGPYIIYPTHVAQPVTASGTSTHSIGFSADLPSSAAPVPASGLDHSLDGDDEIELLDDWEPAPSSTPNFPSALPAPASGLAHNFAGDQEIVVDDEWTPAPSSEPHLSSAGPSSQPSFPQSVRTFGTSTQSREYPPLGPGALGTWNHSGFETPPPVSRKRARDESDSFEAEDMQGNRSKRVHTESRAGRIESVPQISQQQASNEMGHSHGGIMSSTSDAPTMNEMDIFGGGFMSRFPNPAATTSNESGVFGGGVMPQSPDPRAAATEGLDIFHGGYMSPSLEAFLNVASPPSFDMMPPLSPEPPIMPPLSSQPPIDEANALQELEMALGDLHKGLRQEPSGPGLTSTADAPRKRRRRAPRSSARSTMPHFEAGLPIDTYQAPRRGEPNLILLGPELEQATMGLVDLGRVHSPTAVDQDTDGMDTSRQSYHDGTNVRPTSSVFTFATSRMRMSGRADEIANEEWLYVPMHRGMPPP